MRRYFVFTRIERNEFLSVVILSDFIYQFRKDDFSIDRGDLFINRENNVLFAR